MAETKQQKMQSQAPKENLNRKVTVAALFMALGTLSSRLLGLVREILLAALFSRTITDAWYVAFRLPNLIRRLFGEGSLGVSFIPVFIEVRNSHGETEKLKSFIDGFWTLFSSILVTVTLACVIFTEPILHLLLDENYTQIAGKMELTVQMARVMFLYIFLVCSYAFAMAILNSIGQFGLPAFAPTLFNFALIISTVWPLSWQGWMGQALSWGVVAGGVLQLGVLLPPLWKRGLLPRLRLRFDFKPVASVLKSMGPALLGMAVLPVTALINTHFASRLGEGPISFISWADRILELPLSLISVSLGAALLPTLSDLFQKKDYSQFSAVAGQQLRLNLFLAAPAALGVYFLAVPIVQVLFERGKFTPEDTIVTAQVLEVYAWVILTSSMVRVLLPAYHSMKNTWFPAAVSVLCLVIHIILAPLLMEDMGLKGLNLSTVFASVLNLSVLALGLKFFIQTPFWRPFLSELFKKNAVFFLPMLSICLSLLTFESFRPRLMEQLDDGFLARLIYLVTAISFGVFVYFVVGTLAKVDQAQALMGLFTDKLKRRLKKT